LVILQVWPALLYTLPPTLLSPPSTSTASLAPNVDRALGSCALQMATCTASGPAITFRESFADGDATKSPAPRVLGELRIEPFAKPPSIMLGRALPIGVPYVAHVRATNPGLSPLSLSFERCGDGLPRDLAVVLVEDEAAAVGALEVTPATAILAGGGGSCLIRMQWCPTGECAFRDNIWLRANGKMRLNVGLQAASKARPVSASAGPAAGTSGAGEATAAGTVSVQQCEEATGVGAELAQWRAPVRSIWQRRLRPVDVAAESSDGATGGDTLSLCLPFVTLVIHFVLLLCRLPLRDQSAPAGGASQPPRSWATSRLPCCSALPAVPGTRARAVVPHLCGPRSV